MKKAFLFYSFNPMTFFKPSHVNYSGSSAVLLWGSVVWWRNRHTTPPFPLAGLVVTSYEV